MQKVVNLSRKYRDDDINDYVNLIVDNELGSFEEGYKFLLSGNDDKKFGNEDGRRYHVLLTPAVDSAGASTPIRYFLDKETQLSPVNAAVENRRDIFDEIDTLVTNQSNELIKVLFPYNLIQNHWLTGEIIIEKNQNNFTVTVFSHDPYGNGKMLEENYNTLKGAITKRLTQIFPSAVLNFQNATSEYNRRQSVGDVISCGVIVADDILKRVKGQSLSVLAPYPQGCKELRERHVQDFQRLVVETNATRKKFLVRNILDDKIKTTNYKKASPSKTVVLSRTTAVSSLDNSDYEDSRSSTTSTNSDSSEVEETIKDTLDRNQTNKSFLDVFEIRNLILTIKNQELRETLLSVIRNDKNYNSDKEVYVIAVKNALEDFPNILASNNIFLLKSDIDVINTITHAFFDSSNNPKFNSSVLYSFFTNPSLENEFYEQFILWRDLYHLSEILKEIRKLKQLYSGNIGGEMLMALSFHRFLTGKSGFIKKIYENNPPEDDKPYNQGDIQAAILNCYRNISDASRAISTRKDGIKDCNLNFPWDNLEVLGVVLFSKRLTHNVVLAGVEFLEQDLNELERRIQIIIQKELFKNTQLKVTFLDNDRSFDLPSNDERMLLSNVEFKVAESKPKGLKNIRKFTQLYLDIVYLKDVSELIDRLKGCNTNTIQGREALLALLQQIGEVSANISYSSRTLLSDFPFSIIHTFRNAVGHSIDFVIVHLELIKFVNDLNDTTLEAVKQEVLSQANKVNVLITTLAERFKRATSINDGAKTNNDIWQEFPEVENTAPYVSTPMQNGNIDTLLRIITVSLPLDQRATPKTGEKLKILENFFRGSLPTPETKKEQDLAISNLDNFIGGVNRGINANYDKRDRKECSADIQTFKTLIASVFNYPPADNLRTLAEDLLTKVLLVNATLKAKEQEAKQIRNGSKSDYELKQLDYVLISLTSIYTYTEELIRSSNGEATDIRKKCRENSQYHAAVLYHLSVIGQAIQNIKSKEGFKTVVSIFLRREFETLRMIRNAIMHNHKTVDEVGSSLRFYGNDLSLSSVIVDGGRSFDSAEYLRSLEQEIKITQKAITEYYANGVKPDQNREVGYLRGMIYEELAKAVEDDDQYRCAFILEEVLGIKITHPDWYGHDKFAKQGKWYIPINVAKEVLKSGVRITLQDLLEKEHEVNSLCQQYNITILYIFGTLSKYSFESYDRKSGIIIELNNNHSPYNIAQFKAAFKQLFKKELLVATIDELKEYISHIEIDQPQILQELNIEYSNDTARLRGFSETLRGFELFKVVEARNLEKVNSILMQKRYLDQNVEGYVAFHSAMMDYAKGLYVKKHYKIAEVLLSNGANPNIPDKHGRTELHYAVLDNDEQGIQLLLRFGASVDIKDCRGKLPIEYAEADCKVYDLLLEQTKSLSLIDKLTSAIKAKRLDLVKQIIDQHPDIVNAFNKDGETSFNIACFIGDIDVIGVLKSKGADINKTCADGRTGLHMACDADGSNNPEIITQLLAWGISPNTKDENGETALHTASYYPNPNIIEILLQSKADPNIMDDSDMTPLMIFMNSNSFYNTQENQRLVKIFLQYGANPNLDYERREEGMNNIVKKLHEELKSKSVQEVETKQGRCFTAFCSKIKETRRILSCCNDQVAPMSQSDLLTAEQTPVLTGKMTCTILHSQIQFTNPILNDRHATTIFQMAYTNFGNKGVNELIDVGNNHALYGIFMLIRSKLGDEQAIKMMLGCLGNSAITLCLEPSIDKFGLQLLPITAINFVNYSQVLYQQIQDTQHL